MRWYMAFASALLALCGTSLGFADAGQSNSGAYEEVYLNLDEETKALGGALAIVVGLWVAVKVAFAALGTALGGG